MSTYDGFLSYSHAGDGLLAPRLQAGLQRFAKPWWKRRAIRIFRDESSLSANPHLWSSITDALDQSAWFVLLLSPDAAQSAWVNQEVEYWKTHNDPTRILPVLTDGNLAWTDAGLTGDAVPAQLREAFTEEPRWVDLRFARDEQHLDLKNPRFADAVADIASALRGVPKDELASEEVKQHRRTTRTAWAAATLVGLLAIAATIFAAQASTERDRAETEAARAEANAEAEAGARAAAEREAQIAKSRELAASAVSVLDDDPELAVMLALESVATTPKGATASAEAVKALREGLLSNQLVNRFEGVGNFARISPDGTAVYYSDTDANSVVAVDAASGMSQWTSDSFDEGDLGRVEVSPDGSTVTVQVHLPDDQTVFVLNATSGQQITRLDPGEGCSGIGFEGLSEIGGFSPGGEWFTVFTGRQGCGLEPGEGWVSVYDTETWKENHRLNTEDGMGVAAAFSADGTRVVISTSNLDLDQPAELRSFPDLSVINTYQEAGSLVALSPDGERVAYLDGGRGPILANAETGEILSSLAHLAESFLEVEPFVFSPDGSKLLAAARGRDFIFDGMNGQFLGTLGATGPTVSGSFTANGSRLLTSTLGTGLMWKLATGRSIADGDFEGDWINPEQATDGPIVAVNVFDFEGPPQVLVLLDPASGQIIERRGGWGSQLPDGRFVVAPASGVWPDYEISPLEVWDPAEGTTVTLAGCTAPGPEIDEDTKFECPTGDPFFGGGVFGDPFAAVVDPGGSVFAAKSLDSPSLVIVWDQGSLDRVSQFEISTTETLVGMTDTWIVTRQLETPEPVVGASVDQLTVYDLQGDPISTIEADRGVPFDGSVEFTQDDSKLLVRDESGEVSSYDTRSWEVVARWKAHQGKIRGWSVSDDGGRLATVGEEGFVYVWDLASLETGDPPKSPELAFPTNRRPSDVVWVGDDRLAVFLIDLGAKARWFTAFLETEGLVEEAKSRLIRGFSASECSAYQIADCPQTLEEMKNR